MKKFFAVAALILGVVVSQFVAMSQAEAADHYLGNWEGGWKAYLMTETQRGSYSDSKITCTIKTVSPKGTVKYIDYSFSFSGNRVTFNDSTGASGTFYTDSPGEYQVEYAAVSIMIGGNSPSPSSNRPQEVYAVTEKQPRTGELIDHYVITDLSLSLAYKLILDFQCFFAISILQ